MIPHRNGNECTRCKGSGEVPNTYPDCFIDGMETVIDYPEIVACPDCKGTGEVADDEYDYRRDPVNQPR
jgi:hypothetical protein